MPIPPRAWSEYGFTYTDEFIAIPASKTSRGFGVTTRRHILPSVAITALASLSVVAEGVLQLPEILFEMTGLQPGTQLLTVRGSRYALGCIAKGLIVEEALRHPELEFFTT